MKNFTTKVLFAAAMMATASAACAQEPASITVLDNITGEDGATYQPCVQAVSPNHRYVAGPAYNIETGAYGMFVYDIETDNYAVEAALDDFGADIREVNNDGVATGYNEQACFFNIDGTVDYFYAEEEMSTIARDASDDLSVAVGCYYLTTGYLTTACVWKDGKRMDLPVPTDEELGFETNGSSAYYTNSDGSVIVGYVVDNFSTNPLLVWRLQDDGTYECDPVCTRYFSPDGDVEGRPYITFSPQGLSRNGRYVSLNLAVYDETTEWYTEQYIGRLDLESGELEIYRADGQGEIEANSEMTATQVSDNGTVIGYTSMGWGPMSQRNAIIWQKGKTPTKLATLLPDITEIAAYDNVGMNTAIDITPDGRYIAGFAMDEKYAYNGYVIDIGSEAAGVKAVKVADGEAAVEVARYGINGTRLAAPVKGVNIVKMSDGTVKKVIVK